MGILDALVKEQQMNQEGFDRGMQALGNIHQQMTIDKMKGAGQFLLDHPNEAGLKYVTKKYNLSPDQIHNLVALSMTFHNYVDSGALDKPLDPATLKRMQSNGIPVTPNMTIRQALDTARNTPTNALPKEKINPQTNQIYFGGEPTNQASPGLYGKIWGNLNQQKENKIHQKSVENQNKNQSDRNKIFSRGNDIKAMIANSKGGSSKDLSKKDRVKIIISEARDAIKPIPEVSMIGEPLNPEKLLREYQGRGKLLELYAKKLYDLTGKLDGLPVPEKEMKIIGGKVYVNDDFDNQWGLGAAGEKAWRQVHVKGAVGAQ